MVWGFGALERERVDFDPAAGAIAFDAALPAADFRAGVLFAALLSAVLLAAGLFAVGFFAAVLATGILRALADLAGLLRDVLFLANAFGVVDFRFVAVALRGFVAVAVRGSARPAVRRVVEREVVAFFAATFFVATFFAATFFAATFFVAFFLAVLLDGVFDARVLVGLALRDAVGLMRCLRKVGNAIAARCKDAIAVHLPIKPGLYRRLKQVRPAQHRGPCRNR